MSRSDYEGNQNRIAKKAPIYIPNEILSIFVDELADDHKTLLALLLVSRPFNALALPHIYREINCVTPNEPLFFPPALLLQGINTNPGLQFTRGFGFMYPGGSSPAAKRQRNMLGTMLPYLVGLEMLRITADTMTLVEPQAYRLIPTTTRLTRLRLDSPFILGDLLKFLECQPALESLTLGFDSTASGALCTTLLSPGALPNLRSLRLPFEIAPYFYARTTPSLLDFTLNGVRIKPTKTLLKVAIRSVLSIRAISENVTPEKLPVVVAMSSFLPSLEYLSFNRQRLSLKHNLSKLSKTRLKYIRALNPPMQHPDCIAQSLFDVVKTLLVVDIAGLSKQHSNVAKRFYRGSTEAENVILHIPTSSDQKLWWEHVQSVVEEAELRQQRLK